MYKVLLVDDETMNYQLFEKLVDWKEKGFEIAGVAADGQEAIQKYEEIGPDLIFMDIHLPFMDGLECVRCIREADKKVKIVIVSAYGDFSYAQRAIRYDVQDFLLKPVSRLMLNQLVDRMREEIDKRETRTEEDYFHNVWTEAILSLLSGREDADAAARMEQRPVIAGITLLDGQGRLLRGHGVKKAMEELLSLQQRKEGLLGCVVLTDGDAILLWDRALFASETLEAAAARLKEYGSCQIYVTGREETEVRRWLDMFSRKENYGFYHGKSGIYHLEECPFTDHELQMEGVEQCIVEAVAANSAEELMKRVDGLFYRAKQDGVNPQMLKDAVLNLLVQIKFLLRKFEQQESFLLMRNVRLENIHSLHTMEGLKRFIKEKIAATFQDIDESFYRPERRIVFRANAFAELHYREAAFSLQMAADHMGISKNYFTSLYKEQAGLGFWEYVTKLRMEQAAELLVTTDQMTREIGRTVGYESEYHFSRKFKEYTGESPNNYRKSHSSK